MSDGTIHLAHRSGSPVGVGASTTALWMDTNGKLQATQSSGSSSGMGMYSAYALFQDQKAANTAGGTFTQDAWRTRDLNVEVVDTGNIASVASNQVTLEAGTYYFRSSAPTFGTSQNIMRLYDTTATAEITRGQTYLAPVLHDVLTVTDVFGRFTIGVQSVLEVQHYCNATYETLGFGIAKNIDSHVEIFASIEFWKEV